MIWLWMFVRWWRMIRHAWALVGVLMSQFSSEMLFMRREWLRWMTSLFGNWTIDSVGLRPAQSHKQLEFSQSSPQRLWILSSGRRMENTSAQTLLASFQPENRLTHTYFCCCKAKAFNGGNSFNVLGYISVVTLVLTTVWTLKNQSAGILQHRVGGIELQKRWGFISCIIKHFASIGDWLCQKQTPPLHLPQTLNRPLMLEQQV